MKKEQDNFPVALRTFEEQDPEEKRCYFFVAQQLEGRFVMYVSPWAFQRCLQRVESARILVLFGCYAQFSQQISVALTSENISTTCFFQVCGRPSPAAL